MKADYTLLMGDFNSSEKSSVYRFLTNEQSLLGADTYYFDLAEPKNTIEVNQRFDWILLKNPYPAGLPELKSCAIFGTEILEETHLAASDHYGIMVEIEF